MSEYEVAKSVASVVSQQDGFQVFRAECGEARIPINDYRRLLSVSKRTSRIRKQSGGEVAYAQ